MTHHSLVSDTIFEKIKTGDRQIEPRLNDDAHKRIKIGDLIIFASRTTGKEVVAKVVGIVRFADFNDLFTAFPLHYFGVDEREELQQEVAAWSTPASEIRHGVLGVKLHVLR